MKRLLLFTALPTLYFFLVSSTIDITNLFNYEAQTIPNYINRDNEPMLNPSSDEGATLGRVLFYDKNLSRNNTIACASCHQQAFAFSDLAVRSIGLDGGLTGRHSMRLINARFSNENRFFWDKRAPNLEAQTTQPIQDHIEMGFSGTNGQPALDSLIRKLAHIDYYQRLFSLAFGDNTITEMRMQQALAQFIRSIQSFDAKYDTGLAAANNPGADFPNFTDSENRGKRLFMTPPNRNGAGCNGCHQAPGFDLRNNSGNNGVIGVAGNTNATDLTNTRSPTLRDLVNQNGVLNGPMMHDGSKASLRAVIDHYNNVPQVMGLDRRLRGGNGNLGLSEQEKIDLENFLLTLSGTDVYTNEKWSDPFDENGQLQVLDGPCEMDMTAAQDISSGQYYYGASNSITSNRTITNADVTYMAGTSVTLTDGFHAVAGATFTAKIGDCSATLDENEAALARTSADPFEANEDLLDNVAYEAQSSLFLADKTPQITAFPNPFRDELTIQLDGLPFDETVEVYLFNAVGQQVKRWQMNGTNAINLSQLEKGVYFLKVVRKNELLKMDKIIKG